jgi:hypothetical protein
METTQLVFFRVDSGILEDIPDLFGALLQDGLYQSFSFFPKAPLVLLHSALIILLLRYNAKSREKISRTI